MPAALMVGADFDHPHRIRQLVDRLQERLVLKGSFWLLALSYRQNSKL
jgi:hypothetical protein